MTKYILLASVGILTIAIAAGLFLFQSTQTSTDYKVSNPEQVVRQYFESWNNKDWPNMYAVISDGFKKTDSTAKTLSDFKQYADSQGVSGINILSIKEKSDDGKTAIVDYSVEFVLSNVSKKEFKDSFTLKFREADIIKGWKLIHPYGNNIDTS